ncbi:MAG: aminotransferase class IV [Opitutaceae bacterium]|nr:aminotransferase class IV [Opitutaceae bacterium]
MPPLPPPAAIPPTAATKYWIDGRLVPAAEAAVPLTDLAVSRGYAAFDALRTYGKVPFLLDEHLQRLERTCGELFLKLPRPRAEIRDIVHGTIAANALPDCLVRIFITGGDASGFVPEHRERLLVLVDPLRAYAARQYEQGIAIATSRLERTLPGAKSTTYLAGVWETIRAKQRGFDEVVFCDVNGDILEGTTFSIVVVKGNELVSPRAAVLHGITGEHLFQLAAEAGFKIRRAPISPTTLAAADEVFITSSTRELMPVSRVDERTIGNGKPGAITRHLHEMYRTSVRAICG